MQSNKNPLKKIVSNLQNTRRVIFIDEFQVEDIADAMILSDVIPSLIKKRSKIFLHQTFLSKDYTLMVFKEINSLILCLY
ncbi:MAG: hypothetical protein CM15mP104_0120 [Gammaproteobacteria bacterium]|nr:MAG: hypothetical protein CM15mP104_0120 [Gammaproteobacteria bacterium]